VIRRPELSLQRTKRSIVVQGHKTSLSLETGFWLATKEIAAQEGTPVSKLVARIDTDREHANLSSTIRVYVLDYYRRIADRDARAGKAKR
jgi:predicted DNA-binding ribbon-helix-helix protein